MGDNLVRGRVVRLVADKGFGFIRAEGSDRRSPEYFFHRSAIKKPHVFEDLVEGAQGSLVDFQPDTNSDRGPRAAFVQIV